MGANDPIYFKDELPCSALRFVQTALDNMIFYDDNEKLLHAIELGLPELLHEDNRIALKLVVSGSYKTRGRKPKQIKRNMIETAQIVEKMSYWKGYGKPLYRDGAYVDSDTDDASILVAKELDMSWTKVRDIYKQAIKNLNGHGILVSDFAFHRGRGDRIIQEMNSHLGDSYTEPEFQQQLERIALLLDLKPEIVRNYIKVPDL